ncbi:AzlD domain-containing protein [Acidaminobacter hydrogenoformans]|uniref:Branched-chain amino acid transport protein n=1 Tax=Acidaminobacter hydrogenoformans DSM 2784 TaxID=1120920 RepID=A0A1G5RWC0_9FIRM|nr:AzlD domain-containing protein [Acidaminobacter hydrogenoformans]SCZ78414.1 Branched-chain amino acid transport protein [Acidaminobacter hydrogenoformans DSM 2784]
MTNPGHQFITVLLMAAVTYVPRLIPMTLLRGRKLSPSLQNFLKCVPFAVLGALIFPEILYSTSSIPTAALGLAAALALALLRLNVVLVVLGSILAVYLGGLF